VSLSIGEIKARYLKRELKIERFTLGCMETVIHQHGLCVEVQALIKERLTAIAEMQAEERRERAERS